MKHQPNAKRIVRTPAGVVDVTPVVPVAKWGRDHWTTLLYVESSCVDYKGRIDNQRMRTNARVHRKLLGEAQLSAGLSGTDYPTRLRNGDTLDRHDDWSCLEDEVAHGLLTVGERDTKPGRPFGGGIIVAQLTDLGWRVAHAIRRDRGRGTPTVQWRPLPEMEAEIRGAFLEAEAVQQREGE